MRIEQHKSCCTQCPATAGAMRLRSLERDDMFTAGKTELSQMQGRFIVTTDFLVFILRSDAAGVLHSRFLLKNLTPR